MGSAKVVFQHPPAYGTDSIHEIMVRDGHDGTNPPPSGGVKPRNLRQPANGSSRHAAERNEPRPLEMRLGLRKTSRRGSDRNSASKLRLESAPFPGADQSPRSGSEREQGIKGRDAL